LSAPAKPALAGAFFAPAKILRLLTSPPGSSKFVIAILPTDVEESEPMSQLDAAPPGEAYPKPTLHFLCGKMAAGKSTFSRIDQITAYFVPPAEAEEFNVRLYRGGGE
jgi:hypothetical protein